MVKVTAGAGVIVIAAAAEVPLAIAITVTEVELVTDPASTLKTAVATPAAIATEAGVVRDSLSSDSVTAIPPAGATAVSVTVQDAEAGPAMDEGSQVTPNTPTLVRSSGDRLIETAFWMAP
jgi:hypothetical protein